MWVQRLVENEKLIYKATVTTREMSWRLMKIIENGDIAYACSLDDYYVIVLKDGSVVEFEETKGE